MVHETQPTDYRDIVVLYCPEKVGSTTIVSSLRISASDKLMVFHTHDNKIADLLNSPVDTINVSDMILNNNIINPKTNQFRKIYIIDIFRTPIERKISYFFQKISEIHFNNSEPNISNYPIEKIFKRFNDIFMHMSEIDYYNECYNCKKIKTFDFDKKYVMEEINNVVYIKLRLQDSEYWGDILSEIFKTKIYLIHDYDTSSKHIGELYKKFKNEYRLPFNYYKLIENNKTLDIYMDPIEKTKYLASWSKKTCKVHQPFTYIEYKLYQKISDENKFYCANSSNKHYGDDGCLCDRCCNERQMVVSNIVNKVPQNIYIRHPYDDSYNNYIYLKLFSKDIKNPTEITINLVNF